MVGTSGRSRGLGPRGVRRSFRGLLGSAVFAGVWLVSCGGSPPGAPELDGVVGPSADELDGVVHLVELRSRPDYRIVAHDLATGTSEPVFVVPELGAISSLAVDDDGTLALGYTRDYTTGTSGVYLLDPGDGSGGVEAVPRLLVEERFGVTIADLEFDGPRLWATFEDADGSAVVAIDLDDGTVVRRIEDAAGPAPGGDWVAFWRLDGQGARRSIGLLDVGSGVSSTVEVLGGVYDLGHLVADPTLGRLHFTALVPAGASGIEIGDPAEAHGSHDGPSQWLSVDLGTGAVDHLAHHEPLRVRDAVLIGPGQVLATTVDGLVVVAEPPRILVEVGHFGPMAG